MQMTEIHSTQSELVSIKPVMSLSSVQKLQLH